MRASGLPVDARELPLAISWMPPAGAPFPARLARQGTVSVRGSTRQDQGSGTRRWNAMSRLDVESVQHPHSNGRGTVLQVTGLRKRYGGTSAVDGVGFSVGRGEIVGLVGPNGAGKTSIINMILGVLQPDAGRIEVAGLNILTERSRALERTNFAAVYAPLPGNLTVRQNLRVYGLLYGGRDLAQRTESLLRWFGLERFRDVKCGLLSSGEQTRVGLAKAMLNRPELLLLDEPTASLDPAAARDIRARIREFVAQGDAGILWTSHNMYEVEEVCDRVLFLSRGRILLAGDPRSLPREHGRDSLEELFVAVAREPLAMEVG
jgi:ABC-2 type transport system ATP-binding protein